jgi:hypothetical protein
MEKKPDYEIEKFWYQFKISMINFYKSYNYIKSRNIDKWSANLNKLQEKKQYNLIEKSIMDYITLYGLDIIKSGSNYHIQLLNTNIKRWNNITKSYQFFNNNEYKNLFYVCLEIAICMAKSQYEFKELFEDIELIIINKDIIELIKIALELNKSTIIDKLILYDRDLVYKILTENLLTNKKDKIYKISFSGKSVIKLLS